jgi:geranylgeranyl diphosphate synthase type II
MSLPFAEYLKQQQERINRELDRLAPPESEPPEVIHRAMRYSLFAGGKRIRPLLALAAAEAVERGGAGPRPAAASQAAESEVADQVAAGRAEGPPQAGGLPHDVTAAACALELVHTYSLIHDDLPALDNDDLRRGRPTCHKVFGEAMAILAGDALLTLAFEVLSRYDTRVVGILAAAAGTRRGMIAGQVHDLEGEHQQPTAELLERIHRAKTGALLCASVRIGGLCAGADEPQDRALQQYGEHIGLAFQIIDDVLDIEESSESLGKTAGKDAAQHKITFPAVYGIAESRRMAEEQLALAHRSLELFGGGALRLAELADLIVHRKT